MRLLLAFDTSTNRRIDADKRLHVDKSNISKAQVSDYYGHEIPGFADLGLDPDGIYKMFRDPVELEKAAPTFKNIPVLRKHVPVTADDYDPTLIIGSIGSDVAFTLPYLTASTCIWDTPEIAAIETGAKREWSCAYRYDPDMTPGEYEGQAYDGRMTNIQGNHLALVEVGRAGADVYVADSKPKDIDMKVTRIGKALTVALRAASPKFAQDKALSKLVGGVVKTVDKAKLKTDLLALDEDFNAQELDNIIDAILDVEQSPDAVQLDDNGAPIDAPTELPLQPSMDDGGKLGEFLRSKGMSDEDVATACAMVDAAPAVDADPDEKDDKDDKADKKDFAAAMDALKKNIRAEAMELRKAERAVRGTVGDLIDMGSAEQVYRFALDHLKVPHKNVKEVAALGAMYDIAASRKAAPIARDSATVSQLPANLSRIRVAY